MAAQAAIAHPHVANVRARLRAIIVQLAIAFHTNRGNMRLNI